MIEPCWPNFTVNLLTYTVCEWLSVTTIPDHRIIGESVFKEDHAIGILRLRPQLKQNFVLILTHPKWGFHQDSPGILGHQNGTHQHLRRIRDRKIVTDKQQCHAIWPETKRVTDNVIAAVLEYYQMTGNLYADEPNQLTGVSLISIEGSSCDPKLN